METLNDLIDRAERDGLLLYTAYHGLWFTPAELRAANAEGRFRWGPSNWDLRPREDRLSQLRKDLEAAQARYAAALRRYA